MKDLKKLALRLWQNPVVNKPVHTFWQTFVSVFGLGAFGVISNVLATHNLSDAKSAVFALVAAAVAAALSAVKNAYLAQKGV